jgi:diacylglycerol O-acyltransferase / wax synthase
MEGRLDRLSDEDARILKLGRGTIRGHTCKVLVLEAAGGRPLPTLQALRHQIGARLDAVPRLRQRLVPTPLKVANPVWLDDQEFDIARHVSPVRTGGPVSYAEFGEIVAGTFGRRLDRSHPLWQLDVVEELDDGSMALIWRLHHCMADGTTCVRIGSSVLWSDDPDQASPPASAWSPERGPDALGLFTRGVLEHVHRRPGVPRPSGALLRSRGSVRSLLRSREIVRRELSPAAALTLFAHRGGPGRSVAFAMASLGECKRAGNAIGAAVTLNDVVLALVAGGVRVWLQRGHGPMAGVRVKIPVSLHHDGEGDAVANRDSYFFVDLPVAEPDPIKRVLAINRETSERKLDHDADVLYRLGAHPFVAHWAMSPHVFTFNVSNVRGPANDIYVLGAHVREMYSLAEIAHQHALRVAVISAAGSLFFGLCADRDAVKELRVLADGIRHSADELLRVAG